MASFQRFSLHGAVLVMLISGAQGAAAEPPSGVPVDLTQLSLEQLMEVKVATVSGASSYEQKETEAPASISVVTADQIRKFGYRTLADILQSVRGLYTTYDRNYTYLGVRGFDRPGDYDTRLLFLLDGMRLNDTIYDSVQIGTDFIIDVDLIDRVEIIRGPTSCLYGSNAFQAVINIITKRGRDLAGAEAAAAAGSQSTYTGRLSYGYADPHGPEVLLSGTMYNSQGAAQLYYPEFDSPATNNGIAQGTDFDRARSAFAKVAFSPLTLEAAFNTRTKGIPTASFGADFNDPRNDTVDQRGFLDLKLEQPLSSSVQLLGRVYFGDYLYTGASVESGIVNQDVGRSVWLGEDLQVTAVRLGPHKLVVGEEYQANLIEQQVNYDEDPYYQYLNQLDSSSLGALYAQDEITLCDALLLNVGARYDYYSTFGGALSPRLAVIWSPETVSTVKLLFGAAFRAPDDFELHYYTLGEKPNPGLRPEMIRTCELVFERSLGTLRGTASVYYNQIRDLISLTTDPSDNALVYENVDAVESKGFEVELEDGWSNGLEGRVSYAYQLSWDATTGTGLTNSPTHLVKAGLSLPLIGRSLVGSAEEQFTSARSTLQGNWTAAYWITNLTLLAQGLLPGVEVSLSVYNLLDQPYGEPGSTEHRQDILGQDGRLFRVKLAYRF